jgi:hypothetical protein
MVGIAPFFPDCSWSAERRVAYWLLPNYVLLSFLLFFSFLFAPINGHEITTKTKTGNRDFLRADAPLAMLMTHLIVGRVH